MTDLFGDDRIERSNTSDAVWGTNDVFLTEYRFHIILLSRIYRIFERPGRRGVGIMLLCGVGILYGLNPENTSGQTDPIVVEHADTWRGAGVDETFDLIGHVRITHGETTLTSDRVLYRRTQGELVLDGHVQVVRRHTTLDADHVIYYEQDRHAVAHGAVRIIDADEGTTLTGSQGEYYHRPRHAILTGSPKLVRTQGHDDVVITGRRLEYFFAESDSVKRAIVQDSVTVNDRSEGITITCQRVEYRREPERALLSGAPRLVKHQPTAEHDIIVNGREMVYAFTDKHADVYDSVMMASGPLRGVCDTVAYLSDQQQAHLTGNPVLWEGNSELRGDDIVLHLSDDTVTLAIITGNAIGSYAADDSSNLGSAGNDVPRQKSTIQGRQLTVSFDGESVREITALQNATSIYRPSPSASEGPPGHNEVSASRITIILDQGELLEVIAEGSVVGNYKAPHEERVTP